ncbi:ABC transporter ATP-binding protein [Ilumatobacter sp.]|uniref:ABC transporter ATP-binding protein n=1 Tax=Ilumatobacter sp. TaxID=1967498 RepID=UPI003B51B2AD
MELPPPTPGPNGSRGHRAAPLPPPLADGVRPPLRIVGLCKSFGSTVALDHLSVVVPPGACYGLLGPNGSGKSTTMRIVVGLARPDGGTVEVCGIRTDRDIIGVRRQLGTMLDPLQMFDRLSAREFVTTIGAVRGLDPEVVAARSEEMFTALDIAGDADRPIAGYSHGMRKKTALVAALVHRPRLVMLDEPFEGVDPVSTRTMRSILDRFRAGGGTVILSTHVMDVVERVCDHVGVIRDGRIVSSGTIDAVRDGRSLEDAFIAAVGATTVEPTALDWM